MQISVVIPIYNEEHIIRSNIKHIHRFLAAQGWDFEIIVVDDGSTDQSIVCLKELADELVHLHILHDPTNRGKGYAIRKGMLAACYPYTLFLDIDLSTPIEEIIKFIPHLERGSSVVIGSRKMKGAEIIQHQPLLREALGKGFSLLANIFLGTHISDFTCGFKAFRKEVVPALFGPQKVHRWGFDAEILFLAHRQRLKIQEIPIRWINRPATRVRIFKDIIRSFWELICIRFYGHIGLYSRSQ